MPRDESVRAKSIGSGSISIIDKSALIFVKADASIPPMTNDVRTRLERAGVRARWMTRALILLTPVAVALVLWMKGPLGLIQVPPEIEVDPRFLRFPRSLPIIGVGLLVTPVWLFAAVLLDRLFGLYARGIVFSSADIALVRRAGYVLIAVDGMKILQSLLTGAVLTTLGATRPFIEVGLQISVAWVGLSIVVVSRVLDIGRELRERDELTI